MDRPGQPYGLARQVGALEGGAGGGGVALVEDQVEGLQNGRQPLLPAVRAAEAHTPHLLLGPADALRHRRLRDQIRTGDLRRGQAADGTQRERDLGGRCEVRMAAQEEQREGVVLAGSPLPRRRGGEGVAGRERRRPLLALPPRLLAAQGIGQPPRGHLDQPAARIAGQARRGPLPGRREQRLLYGVLGRVEVPVPSDQRAEDLRRVPAQQVLDLGCVPHRRVRRRRTGRLVRCPRCRP